ncbi:MAG TPA: ATP-binding protein [Candidatus Brocadiia bacterium]|nr:ATP-binding protein [Candidatus Brocadiia bacterium]
MDIWEAFGFRRGNAFLAAPRFEWTGLRRAVHRVRHAVANREWLLIYGPPGAGKTEALRAFAEAYGDDCWIANVTAMRRRNMNTTPVADSVFLDLDLAGLGERPAARAEQRTRQVVRLIGVRGEERPVLVVMDEASSFQQDLLNDIKFLRDQRWSGRRDKSDRRAPFALVMCGWETLAKRLAASRHSDIRITRDPVPPMSRDEVCAFLDHVGFKTSQIGAEAREALWTVARYPGEVMHVMAQAMERALLRGRRELLDQDIAQGNAATLKAKLLRLGLSYAVVARASGQASSTVCRILNGEYTGKGQTYSHVVATAARLVEDAETMQEAKRPTRRVAV